MPAQVSSSSSDRGSKLRGPSQKSPRVASKWDVNITKLNLLSVTFRSKSVKGNMMMSMNAAQTALNLFNMANLSDPCHASKCGSLDKWAPAQVSSSPSDRGSKLQGPSQNSPHVASKRDDNITKLN
ncbi:hypothetical protein AVEN_252671-1 [Araneus ventricosus]|uniref:Uncharacterized protein n=1 Tax=Araneus ventricosus TaxID=182803 RepID=A0A4Y2LJ38_ARAVE|nr:hypothetical protein AVEN_252671-1 [Araneus ventricosus]